MILHFISSEVSDPNFVEMDGLQNVSSKRTLDIPQFSSFIVNCMTVVVMWLSFYPPSHSFALSPNLNEMTVTCRALQLRDWLRSAPPRPWQSAIIVLRENNRNSTKRRFLLWYFKASAFFHFCLLFCRVLLTNEAAVRLLLTPHLGIEFIFCFEKCYTFHRRQRRCLISPSENWRKSVSSRYLVLHAWRWTWRIAQPCRRGHDHGHARLFCQRIS